MIRQVIIIIMIAMCGLPLHGEAADCSASELAAAGQPLNLREAEASSLLYQFDSGARWELCWHIDDQAGLVLSRVYYGAPAEQLRQVLDAASLAQILFKYDEDVQARHLLSETGLGGQQIVKAASPLCDDGQLLVATQGHQVCQRVRQINHLNKVRGSISKRRHELSLYAWSSIGTHTYQQIWRLSEDGEITPSLAFSGRISRYTTDSRFGIKLGDSEHYAASATLLVNWRLDFNINGTPNNDVVDEIEFPATVTDVVKRPISIRSLSSEVSRRTHRENFRGWRISDADQSSGSNRGTAATTRIGYYLDPQSAGYAYTSKYNPWSQFDFHVTASRACEKLASVNNTAHNPCDNNLDEYLNNEIVAGADPVVWFSLSRHFTPRLEDFPAISAIEIGFKLMPFDWSSHTPFSPPENTKP